MRFGIAAKLALLLALVGVLAAGIASFHGFLVSRDLLVDSAKDNNWTKYENFY